MEVQSQFNPPEATSYSRDEGNIHSVRGWNEHQKELESAEDELVVDPDDIIMKTDIAKLNPRLDRYAAEQRAYGAADKGKSMSSMSDLSKKQKSKPPEKPGFFAKIFGWFSRKKS